MFKFIIKTTVSLAALNLTPYLPVYTLRVCSVKSTVKMEEFYGKKYQMKNSENFDDLMAFLHYGFIQRQIASTLRPVQYLTRNDDGTYIIHFKCTLVYYQVVFTPGVEFTETKPDGIKVQALITIEGNKIYHRQIDDSGRTLNHVYEFEPEKLVITTTGPELECVVKRNYVPV